MAQTIAPLAAVNPAKKATEIAHQSYRQHAVNVYPFTWPEERVPMYFSSKPFDASSKLHPRTWPTHIDSVMHGIQPTPEARIHTSFNKLQKGATAFDIHLPTENEEFVKHYYRYVIAQHFKGVDGILSRKGFINETLVYVPEQSSSNSTFVAYNTFSIRVSIGTFTDLPELIVSYMGHSYVLRKNLSTVQQTCDTENIGFVACGNRLIRFRDLYSHHRPDEYELLPMLTNGLRKELGLEWPVRSKTNRYKTYKEQVDKFFNNYLSDKPFRKLFPFINNQMLTLPKERVWKLEQKFSKMLFGADSTGNRHEDTDAFAGLKNYGPYERITQKVHIFFIAPESERETVDKWRKYIFGEGVGFKGLPGYVGIPCSAPTSHDVFYTNPEDQAIDIAALVSMKERKDDTEYYAIYITPHSRNARFDRQKQIYHDVREALFTYNVQMQCITVGTAKATGMALTCALNNIAIATLGKLGGTPWAVKPINEHELVIGISAYTHPKTRLKYRAAAVCFESNGKFRRQNAFTDDKPTALAGKVAAEIRRYRDLYGNPTRLIIHYYKKMSKSELDPITHVLEQLNLDIDVYVVTINKSESADLIAFDVTEKSASLLPGSGTIVRVTKETFLLFNNTRQLPSDNPSLAAGNPYGLKLHVMCTNPEKMEKGIKALDIIAQVYQFSRLYWSTGKQQPYPITQLYTERLARHASHTTRTDLQEAAKARPYYL